MAASAEAAGNRASSEEHQDRAGAADQRRIAPAVDPALEVPVEQRAQDHGDGHDEQGIAPLHRPEPEHIGEVGAGPQAAHRDQHGVAGERDR